MLGNLFCKNPTKILPIKRPHMQKAHTMQWKKGKKKHQDTFSKSPMIFLVLLLHREWERERERDAFNWGFWGTLKLMHCSHWQGEAWKPSWGVSASAADVCWSNGGEEAEEMEQLRRDSSKEAGVTVPMSYIWIEIAPKDYQENGNRNVYINKSWFMWKRHWRAGVK